MKHLSIIMIWTSFLASFVMAPPSNSIKAEAAAPAVVINEIAWMGTTQSYSDEWLELYNQTNADINLSGWTLESRDGSFRVPLSGQIHSKDTFLLERTDDNAVPGLRADEIYSDTLVNNGLDLILKNNQGTIIDEAGKWYAGDNSSKAAMVRVSPKVKGTDQANWRTAKVRYDTGFGTPDAVPPTDSANLQYINNAQGSINAYFNKPSDSSHQTNGGGANAKINLETRLIDRIHQARSSIDIAIYEINLPNTVEAIIDKAAQGIDVRMIVDAKDPADSDYAERYQLMRSDLERLSRGKDGQVGTNDDVHLYADSPIFAVKDPIYRTKHGLEADGYRDFPNKTLEIGNHEESGYVIASGEEKASGGYYSPANQMHNKFVVIDGERVWTGSWNYTTTGLYGSDANRDSGILEGNTQNALDIHSSDLASIYMKEFNEMWGSDNKVPAPLKSNFGNRKSDNTLHTVNVGGSTVNVYFTGGDDAIGHVVNYINHDADYKAYFSIFSWSDQPLVNALKVKWEGSDQDLTGTLTGFDVKGVFDSSFWTQWWSASVDMTGRTAKKTSTGNPNIRWNNPAPVYEDHEDRKLHDKYMIIDPGTTSDPAVITGSTNWSTNGNVYNDENLLIIHNGNVANQYTQDFFERYAIAQGGK
ncbi:phospholipase D-like protein [Scopulibacillus darangshiensis]|uniref:phospholipase D n=1 Tax=Scopulibacillus darangshiensis TaxID=442528 RepID=A0A4R2PCL3_9BACL|nr:phospholipase D-like domain-containing protein [Scopulibacillus darangshiensis]TCP31821.1 phospholipase D-like protein [Scopulibacillus darangshiensis]